MYKFLPLLLWIVTGSLPVAAQVPVDSVGRCINKAYHPAIRTVVATHNGEGLTHPVVQLNSGERIVFNFDMLTESAADLSYTVVACNADWTPNQNFTPFEYLDGFTEGSINNYEFSYNTYNQNYVHYRVELPNIDMQVSKSGNYVLKVFDSNNPDSTLLTHRFMVVEPLAEVTGRVKRAAMMPEFYTHQELQVEVDMKELPLSNAFQEVSVTIMQNFRWDNALYDMQPIFVKGQTLTYTQEGKVQFEGNNEFRFFDTRDMRLLHFSIRGTDNKGTTAYLTNDEIRTYQQYDYYKDANGHFVIGREDGFEPQLEAEYVDTRFTLLSDTRFTTGDIYVVGDFNNWQPDSAYRMEYVPEKYRYQTTISLKQGYYNYYYAYVTEGTETLDIAHLEGSFFETENDYQVLVYFRPVGQRYDRLVALKTLNLLKQD